MLGVPQAIGQVCPSAVGTDPELAVRSDSKQKGAESSLLASTDDFLQIAEVLGRKVCIVPAPVFHRVLAQVCEWTMKRL